MSDDKRLIEDYLPIQAISKEASREKSVRKGHISTLHLWWARRPLVACRAAVYGALVPASQFVPANGPDNKKQSLGRANAARFVTDLCKYPGSPRVIQQAQEHILDAHAERLTRELEQWREGIRDPKPGWVEEFHWPEDKTAVTVEDIVAGRAPRPRVLDMFAGGGAIPLEALRLGCEAYALDLNPVAHIIELCTLVYPQKYGRPDPTARGMTGPKNAKGETTWGGLAEEVRYWGKWVLEKVRAEIGDLYPPIPDPKAGKLRKTLKSNQTKMAGEGFDKPGQQELAVDTPLGYLTPVAYLWTRTVKCKNPACGATVPLVKQTWLCKKDKRSIGLKMVARKGHKQVCFDVCEATSEKGLGFDPSAFSEGGNATCPFCGTVADAEYVQDQGKAKRAGKQMMAVVCTRQHAAGKVYLAADDTLESAIPGEAFIEECIDRACRDAGSSVPGEAINPIRPSPNARGLSPVTRHGLTAFADLFTRRQLASLLTFAAAIRRVHAKMVSTGYDEAHARAIAAYLGILVDRQADYNSSLARWHTTGEKISGTFGRHALAMVWDFAELAPFGDASGCASGALDWITGFIETEAGQSSPGTASRGSATALRHEAATLDAVITDPPYYDNVPYADVSDFFYVWLKRSIGPLFREHFATELTPKKSEATALASRHQGDMSKATAEYEKMMLDSLREAGRALKSGGTLAVVYAHKTTLGWATLVDALRQAGFVVTEAWPLDTEMRARMIAADTAALASSIFLVARKRDADTGTGSYETDVRPELERIVRERVETLWEMEITGADLVIACVGAGLRAFTKYSRVEFANGEEVPAERFLTEVETVVLETILARLSKEVGGNGSQQRSLAGVDPATRFYILWRYTFRSAELDAGEAIIFANGTHVELDGAHGLCAGGRALIEKKKSKYRLLDYTERGDDAKLGLPGENGQAAPLIDALHRMLWLMDHKPGALTEFLQEARPNLEQVRLVAQALGGPALKGLPAASRDAAQAGGVLREVSAGAEAAALGRLTANWRSLTEGVGPLYGPKGK